MDGHCASGYLGPRPGRTKHPEPGRSPGGLVSGGRAVDDDRFGGGGSDANVFNERGITSIIIATGPADVHTVNESVDAERMVESAQWLVKTLAMIAADTA